ncbi:hypothetical protein HDU67_006134 [Dinochytrium kinnereticum]|nr:hypothetical protein HDU67_006134 [Dinochytrium kinnereticum]
MSETRPLLTNPRRDEDGILERAERATRSFSRRALIIVVFIGTLVGTLSLVLLVNSLSWMSPVRSINYGTLSVELEALRKEYGVKGFAMGVVKDGVLVHGEAFGDRNDAGEKVDLDTIFEIGSLTKAFTSFSIASLVQEKLLSWDTPVSELYDVEFKDPVTNNQANLVDVLSHRTGLPSHAYFATKNLSLVSSNIKYLEPTAQLRQKFQYSNLMYGIAGLIGGKAYGKGWHSLIADRILTPLGMSRTFTHFNDARNSSNVADGFDGDQPVEPRKSPLMESVASAASISSTINDMAKWAAVWQRKGKSLSGEALIDETHFSKLVQQYITIDSSAPFDFNAYGLGQSISMYRGKKMYSHLGGTFSQASAFITFPDENISIILLSNNCNNFASVASKLSIDRIIFPSLPEVGWVAIIDAEEELEAKKELAEFERLEKLRQSGNPSPSLPASKFVGVYSYPGYGTIEILRYNLTDDNLDLYAKFTELNHPPFFHLKHWFNETYGAISDSYFFEKDSPTRNRYGGPRYLITFTKGVDADGNESIVSFSCAFEPALPPFVFERVV